MTLWTNFEVEIRTENASVFGPKFTDFTTH